MTGTPSADSQRPVVVRLGRLWADYARSLGIPGGRRVDQTDRYAWMEQSEDDWRAALVTSTYHVVAYRAGWDPDLTARPDYARIAGAAMRARRQLVLQSPAAWHGDRLDAVSHQDTSSVMWMVNVTYCVDPDYMDPECMSIFRMPIESSAFDAIVAGMASVGVKAIHEATLYEHQSDTFNFLLNDCAQGWRVWAVDRNSPGWMAERLVWIMPIVAMGWVELRRGRRERATC